MSKMPLVSVIVPVYNVEQYIHTCLDSLVRQTYKNIEIIVVNDCSPGGIEKIIVPIKKKYDTIRLINLKENVGLFRARIVGMRQAKGDYIAHIDGDDSVSVDYIERLVNRALATKADVVLGEMMRYHEFDKSKEILNLAKDIGFDEVLSGKNLPLSELLRRGNFFWEVCGKLYSKPVIDAMLEDVADINRHIIMGEDMLFNVHIFQHCKTLARAEFAFYYYLLNKGSVTAKGASVAKMEKILGDLQFVLERIGTFLRKKSLFEKYERQYGYIRNMQAAKYYLEIVDSFSKKEAKSLLAKAKALAHDEVGLATEIELRQYDAVTDIKDLQWRLESMNSIKVSAKKLASNIKRKMKELVRVYGER